MPSSADASNPGALPTFAIYRALIARPVPLVPLGRCHPCARPVLGIDDPHLGGSDDQQVDVGGAPRDSAVMEKDRPIADDPLQVFGDSTLTCGTLLPVGRGLQIEGQELDDSSKPAPRLVNALYALSVEPVELAWAERPASPTSRGGETAAPILCVMADGGLSWQGMHQSIRASVSHQACSPFPMATLQPVLLPSHRVFRTRPESRGLSMSHPGSHGVAGGRADRPDDEGNRRSGHAPSPGAGARPSCRYSPRRLRTTAGRSPLPFRLPFGQRWER